MWRDQRDIRADEMDLRHDYAAQRAGTNEQRDIAREQADIQRDRADIRSDVQDIRKDRADLRADQRDLRDDRSAMSGRVARNGHPPLGAERVGAATHSGVATASARPVLNAGANSVQRTPMTQPTAKPQGLTPTVMANNAAAESKKPPAPHPVHQAWWHWIW
jgi:hypothetical protein